MSPICTMANFTSYAASDTEEIDLHPEPISSTESVILQNKWSDVTVASEIRRGIKLRERKPTSWRKDKLPVIINLPKPNTPRKRKTRNLLSKSCVGCSDWKTPSKSNSVKPKSMSTQNMKLKLRIKAEKETTCPMRIAELAVPSKRHCIDTWRNKSYILPDDMVDRLKQYVMDQRPVVQLPEALYFFQRRKSKLRKKKIQSAKDEISRLKKQMEMPLRCLNTRALCIILAQKIVLKLLIPLKITLNSDLEKLAQVVVSDMVRITKGKKYIKPEYLRTYRSIHSDVVNKITVWMIGVLEDQVYKQFEEDLRDLEEEEGPVLDFLDDVLDNVFNICLPKPLIEYIEEESETSSESDLSSKHSGSGDELTDTEYFSNQIYKLLNDLNDQYETTENNVNISDKGSLQTDIDTIINNILKDFIDSNDTLSITKKTSFDDYHDKVTDAEYFQNEILSIINIICKQPDDTFDSNTNEVIITHLDNTKPLDDRVEIPQDSVSPIRRSIDKMSEETKDYVKQSEDNVEGKTSEAVITHFDNSKHITDDKLEKTQDSESAMRGSIDKMSEEIENRIKQSEDQPEIKTSEALHLDDNEHIIDDKLDKTQSSESATRRSIDLMSEDTEDRSKKVMFSILDIVKTSDAVDPSDTTEPDISKQTSNNNKSNSSFTRSDILFSEPNENLLSKLSEIDEKDTLASPLPSGTGEKREDVKESEDENLNLEEVITYTVSLVQGDAEEHVPSDNLSTENTVTQGIFSESNEKDILLPPIHASPGEKLGSAEDVLLLPHPSADEKIESEKDILLPPLHPSADEKIENEKDILLPPIHSIAGEKLESNKEILSPPLHSSAGEKIESAKDILLTPPLSSVGENIEIFLKPKENNVDDDTKLKPNKVDSTYSKETIESLLKHKESLEKILPVEEMESNIDDSDNLTQLNKEIQVNTYARDTVACTVESQTDPMKSLQQVNLVMGGTTITSIDPKPVVRISIDENITSEIEKHDTGKQKGIITERFDNNMKLVSQWKVPPAAQQTNAHGDPRDSSMPEPVSITQCDFRKWCEDLDKGFENLDIWKEWLQNTCMEATDMLKKKNELLPCFNQKYTILCRKLKDNVDKDASKWRKMNKQTHERFERFRMYYRSNENARCACNRNF